MVAWAHLAVLWAMAVAQPLLDVLADSPDFFVARGNTRADILILALVLVLGPPTVLAGVEAVIPTVVRRAVHLFFVAVLAAAFVLQVLNDTGSPARVLIPLAVVLGVALAYAYARLPAVRSGLTLLSPLPLLVLVLFIFVSPVSKLILTSGDEARAGGETGGDHPVVMVILDEMATTALMDQGEDIDATRYPNFAALSRTSTWYRNATTAADVTSAAVPALLSGNRPERDDLPIVSDFPQNLFTLLGDSYRFEVEEPVTNLCPERLCGEEARPSLGSRLRSLADDLSVVSLHLLAPDDLEDDLPAVDRTFGRFRGGGQDRASPAARAASTESFSNRLGQIDRFLGRIDRDDPKRSLYLLHVGLPHVPWQYLPSGRQYAVSGADLPTLKQERWESDPWMVQQAYQRYLLQVGYTDRRLGELMRRLRSEGRWDDAMMVVTADHGVSFHAGRERRSVARATVADIAGVPLFVKEPGQRRGQVDDAAVRTIDVLPTIAQELGIAVSREVDGRSLDDAPNDDRVEVFRRAGGDVTVTFSGFLRLRREAVDRQVELFGARDGGSALFAIGPDPDLIGRLVGDLDVRPSSGVRAELDGAQSLAAVDPGARLLPAFISGRLTGTLPTRARLAVAVNGRVTGSTYTFGSGEATLFASLAPEDAFTSGPNEVDLITVQGEGSNRTLSQVSVEGPVTYSVASRDGADRIMRGNTVAATVRPGAVKGYVERVIEDAGTISVRGWSATPDGPADRVVVFANGRLLAVGRPIEPRPDVAEAIGRDALRSQFTVSGVADPGTSVEDVRVFGMRGRLASELPTYSRRTP